METGKTILKAAGIFGTAWLTGIALASYGGAMLGIGAASIMAGPLLPLIAGAFAAAYLGAKFGNKIRKNISRRREEKKAQKQDNQGASNELQKSNKLIKKLQEDIKQLQQQKNGVNQNTATLGIDSHKTLEILRELKERLNQFQQKSQLAGQKENKVEEIKSSIKIVENKINLFLPKENQQIESKTAKPQQLTQKNEVFRAADTLQQLEKIEQLLKKLQKDLQKETKQTRVYKTHNWETTEKKSIDTKNDEFSLHKKKVVKEHIGTDGVKRKLTDVAIGGKVDYSRFMSPMVSKEQLQIFNKTMKELKIAQKQKPEGKIVKPSKVPTQLKR
ncbi:hypothetical protein [Aquimarina sp. RZ0]|uniref:hypothetical protein n=1 Tax=Aquimarina sp. RZ0 TaxID=2607730 RepID=UPI0011F0E0BA|nr:hypothetical protein [Aquimarina sp. RZ0]KAA1242576.1 hypothetical protein F0000_24975 [Aquimarina sp. RZ0]